MAGKFSYKLGKRLGEGHFGTVFKSENPTGAPFSRQYPTVAVKKITVSAIILHAHGQILIRIETLYPNSLFLF